MITIINQNAKRQVAGLIAWASIGAVLFTLYLIFGWKIALGFAVGTVAPMMFTLTSFVLVSTEAMLARPIPHYVSVLGWLTMGLGAQANYSDIPLAEIAVEDTLENLFLRNVPILSSIAFILLFTSLFVFGYSQIKLQHSIIAEKLVGRTGRVRKWKGDKGRIRLDPSESISLPQPKRNWKARSSEGLAIGDHVIVVKVQDKLKFVTVAMVDENDVGAMKNTTEATVSKIKTWHWIAFGLLQLAVSVLGHFFAQEFLTLLVVPGLSAIFCSITPRLQTRKGMGFTTLNQIMLWVLLSAMLFVMIYN